MKRPWRGGWYLSALLLAQAAPAVDFAPLERVVLDELKETHTPGAALAIISEDHVIFAKGFGVASVEAGAPVTPDMLFRLGSTTKMFTAAALLSLAEEHKVDLNQPVGNYIKGLAPKVAQVTANQLLSHTAGLTDVAVMDGPHDDAALARFVLSWKDDVSFAPPGEIYSYSNPGYHLAGYLIEVLSGKPFADAVSERVFRPLGMRRSTFRPIMAMTYPLAQGHEMSARGEPRVIHPAPDNAGNWPAGSLFSSVNDLSHFVIAFLNNGQADGRGSLAPAVLARLASPVARVPGSEEQYGYGLSLRQDRGIRWVEHGGTRAGYVSLIRMAPERHFAVILLANQSSAVLPKTAAKAAELMLPLEPAVEPKRVVRTMSAAEMAAYAGAYSNNRRLIELMVRDGTLYARADGVQQPLVSYGENRLSATNGPPAEYFVVRGGDGTPRYLCVGLRALRKL